MSRLIYFILFYSPLLFSNTEYFKISPYTVRTDNGEVVLKLQLNQTKKINIIAFGEGDENQTIYNEEILADQKDVKSVKLGRQNCNDKFGYKISILIGNTLKQIAKNDLPEFSCETTDGFTFGFISDTQKGIKNHTRMSEVIKEYAKSEKVSFILHTGDITHNGGINDEWLDYFTVAKTYLENTPIIAAVGNHSYNGQEKNPIVPKNFQRYVRWKGSEKIGYMTSIFPNFQLVIINSNFEKLKGNFENQLRWVEDTFKEAARFGRAVIVGMHHPPFATSVTSGDHELKVLREKFVPLFEKYKVKLVLTGHTHVYERSFKDGVHYVIAGPSGGIRGIPMGKNPYSVFRKFLAMTFSSIKVDPKKISLKSWDHKRRLIDQVVIDL